MFIIKNATEFLIKSKELTKFIDSNKLDWRTLHKWKNKGKIKIRNIKISNKSTINTINWEIRSYS